MRRIALVLALSLSACSPDGAAPKPPPKRPAASKPAPIRPSQSADRSTVEILHAGTVCDPYDAGRVCTRDEHWRVLIDEIECLDEGRLRAAIRKEVDRRQDKRDPMGLFRGVLLWSENEAPFGIVRRILVEWAKAGVFDVDCVEYQAEKGQVLGARPVDTHREGAKGAPEELELREAWKDGSVMNRLGEGEWNADGTTVAGRIDATGAGDDVRIVIEAADDVPWSSIAAVVKSCKNASFDRILFAAQFAWMNEATELGNVTEAEAAGLARQIEEAVGKGTPEFLDEKMDKQEMLKRILKSMRLSVDMYQVVSWSVPRLLGLADQIRQADGLRFLRVRVKDGHPRPLFRLVVNGQPDYVELDLARRSDGSIRIVDLSTMGMGGALTEYVRQMIFPDAATVQFMNRLRAPTPADLTMSRRDLRELMELVTTGQPQEALEYFERNEATMKGNRRAHAMRIVAARLVGAESFRKAIEGLEAAFPEDPALNVLRIRRFVIAGQYDQALSAVDKLDGVVGGDPYLDALRAAVYVSANDLPRARGLAEKATEKEPTLAEGWRTLIGVCLRQKDFKAAVRFLAAAEVALKQKLAGLESLPGYAEFVESLEYKSSK